MTTERRPRFIVQWFEHNPETGYYRKSTQQPQRTEFRTIPFELKVELTQLQDIKVNAKEIIRGREKYNSGGYKFFTGLIPIPGALNWFMGDHPQYERGIKHNSLVVFHFAQCNSLLRVFYFNRYHLHNTAQNIQFTRHQIPQLSSLL